MPWTEFAPWDQPLLTRDPFDFAMFRGDLPLVVTAPSDLLDARDRFLLPPELVGISGNIRLPATIDWTPFAWERAMLGMPLDPFQPMGGDLPGQMPSVPDRVSLADTLREGGYDVDRMTVDTDTGVVRGPLGQVWNSVQEFWRELPSGLQAALQIAGLGLVGTGLGQLVSGGGETLRLPERQPTAAQTAGSEAFARALGQPSLANVLGAPGDGTTPVGVGGTLSGSQNLEALIRASLYGQRSVAELMAERVERERLADRAASPAEAAIRARALAELPGFLRPGPEGMPTLAQQPIDLTRVGDTWQMPDGAATAGGLAPKGGQAGFNVDQYNRLVPEGGFPGGYTDSYSYFHSLPPTDPNYMESRSSPWPGGAATGGVPPGGDSLAWQDIQRVIDPLRAWGAWAGQPGTLAGGAEAPLTPELDARVRALLGGPETYTDPGLAALRARISGTLAPAQPLSDEIQQMLAAELRRVAGGQVSNPALERKLAEEERTQREFLARTLGPNYELATAGQAALGELRQRHQAVREEDRRTTLATLSPLEESRRRFGIEFPEATRARELGLLLPEERARAEFGYQVPRTLRLSELGLLAPESRARYQFSRTQPLEEARFGEAVRSRGFEERLGLTGFGRRSPIESAQTLGQMVPISPLLGIETEATRAQREALGVQAAIESFRARQQESASLAQQLGSVFGLAGAFGFGPRLTG